MKNTNKFVAAALSFANGAAGGKGAVHTQVGEIQQAEGDVDAQRHNAPDEALGNSAGTGAQQRQWVE